MWLKLGVLPECRCMPDICGYYVASAFGCGYARDGLTCFWESKRGSVWGFWNQRKRGNKEFPALETVLEMLLEDL